jgi:hypothetical protein
VDRFHRFVDRRRSRSTMDQSSGVATGSPELTLEAASMSGSSPRVGEKGEELWGILTKDTKEQHGGGIGRAMVNGGSGGRGSVGTCFGVRR